MAYPNSKTIFDIKINKNASGYALGPEYFNVPGSSPYEIYLDHVPKSSASTTIGASGGAAWTEVLVTPTSSNHYLVDYDTGKLTFYSGNANDAAQAVYQCLGDDIMAEHINLLQTELTNTQGELGENPRGSQVTVSERLNVMQADINSKGAALASGINGHWITDNTVRAGAIMDDIKGATWVSDGRPVLADIVSHRDDPIGAHAATAISANAPGTTAIINTQQHINQKGSASQTPTNPHGISLGDLGGSFSGDVSYYNLQAQWVGISGNRISLDIDGPEEDQWIDFYNAGAASAQWIRWNTAGNGFEFSSHVTTMGGITASGNILPEASGSREVGTQQSAFSQVNSQVGRFETLYANDLYTSADTIYIGGVSLDDYIDSKIALSGGVLGAWASRNIDQEYTEGKDGFVVGSMTKDNIGGTEWWVTIQTPTGQTKQIIGADVPESASTIKISFTVPVRKSDTWKLVTSGDAGRGSVDYLNWIPMGN